ncbi:YqzE family protein [Bacillus pinisoli]|uniref:YqzE family protein n=1 Tax=Bacillus pinisoli TaxID=2901866 RepID=UPI001FF28A0E|nr:YqzE family protein [Bacillus pinisoli]
MTFNDLVKFVTQQFVSYLDKPKQQRIQTKQDKKSTQPPMMSRWFGIVPIGFMLYMKKEKKQQKK